MATRPYREGDDFPINTEDMKTAPAPLTKAERMGPVRIGKSGDVTAAERKKIMRDMPMEPVMGKEVGVRKAASKSEVYERGFAAGGYTKAADGCVKRGKTRGTMVTMCGGGYAKKGK